MSLIWCSFYPSGERFYSKCNVVYVKYGCVNCELRSVPTIVYKTYWNITGHLFTSLLVFWFGVQLGVSSPFVQLDVRSACLGYLYHINS